MTREEAKEELKGLKYDTYYDEEKEALDMAIKALDQKSILDKIKAEIEQLPTKTRTNWDGCCPDIDYPEIEYVDVTKKQLLDIFDKYKTESESEVCKDCYYNDGEVHAECVICDKIESEGKK